MGGVMRMWWILPALTAACAGNPAAQPTPPKTSAATRTEVVVPAPEQPVPVPGEPAEAELAVPKSELPSPGHRVTASGLGIEEIRPGSGAVVEPTMRVRMHYVGTLEDGTVFDSSRQRARPFEVDIGKGYLIKGFEEGVLGMRVGEVRRLTIPPELGYGSRPLKSNIPADATLVFEIELLEIL